MANKKGGMDAVIASIQKNLGDREGGIIQKYGERKDAWAVVDTISFGFPEVDKASNSNGLPVGKFVEIFGEESGGKSLLGLKLIASAQKKGMKCCLVDAETSFDPKWARKQGVDVDELYIINDPMTAERTLDYIIEVCKSGAFGLVVLDSTAALVPKEALEGSLEDKHMALLARVMSQACAKLKPICGSTKTSCVFINQIREKMNVMAFQDNKITPGGRAMRFYSDIRISVTPGSTRKVDEGDGKRVVARTSYVKFLKNKVAVPWGECKIEIVFDEMAMNPVFMLCSLAKGLKYITTYKKEFKVDGEPTGCFALPELSDWVIKNEKTLEILEAVEEILEKNPYDKDMKEIEIDAAILEMKTDPSKIVSPIKANAEKSEETAA